MTRTHKDLPGGSQDWADEVDRLMAENKALTEVVKRLCQNAGLDFSNPGRGINAGDTPSVNNPVGQKLSSLADVNTYNVLDGQALTWNQKGQSWLPITPVSGGMTMRAATADEKLNGELVIDGTYESASVFGYQGKPDPTHSVPGTGDSYGLVGTSDASAYLHAAGRYYGGTQKFHSYVATHPYYVHMKAIIADDVTGNWIPMGGIEIGRQNVVLQTPLGKYGYTEDGSVMLQTNWFFTPAFTTANRPVRTVDTSSMGGAQIFDITLNKPLWRNTSGKWIDAMGNLV